MSQQPKDLRKVPVHFVFATDPDRKGKARRVGATWINPKTHHLATQLDRDNESKAFLHRVIDSHGRFYQRLNKARQWQPPDIVEAGEVDPDTMEIDIGDDFAENASHIEGPGA